MGNHFGNGNMGTSAVKIGLPEGDWTASLGLRLRLWWNWQTRYFEVVVGQPVQVQVLLSAPSLLFNLQSLLYPAQERFLLKFERALPWQILHRSAAFGAQPQLFSSRPMKLVHASSAVLPFAFGATRGCRNLKMIRAWDRAIRQRGGAHHNPIPRIGHRNSGFSGVQQECNLSQPQGLARPQLSLADLDIVDESTIR